MNQQKVLDRLAQKDVADLVFEIERLDVGWHTFRVVWSDDFGNTKLISNFSRNGFDLEVNSLDKEGIVGALSELRSSISRCNE